MSKRKAVAKIEHPTHITVAVSSTAASQVQQPKPPSPVHRDEAPSFTASGRRKVVGRGMYGMWGPITDPGERVFSNKVEALGVDIGRSPYRDYEVNQIAADFNATPDAVHLLWGSSLGCNNCSVVALYTHVVIHGAWGFQASLAGARVGFPSNVLFAHEVYNPNIFMTGGLGAYEWEKAANNHVTNLYTSKRYDFHPGETAVLQAMFLAEMQRVITAAGG